VPAARETERTASAQQQRRQAGPFSLRVRHLGFPVFLVLVVAASEAPIPFFSGRGCLFVAVSTLVSVSISIIAFCGFVVVPLVESPVSVPGYRKAISSFPLASGTKLKAAPPSALKSPGWHRSIRSPILVIVGVKLCAAFDEANVTPDGRKASGQYIR
jgi:hypothetical protein